MDQTVKEYCRIKFDDLDKWMEDGWQPVSRDGRVLVESLCAGDLLVCVVEREISDFEQA